MITTRFKAAAGAAGVAAMATAVLTGVGPASAATPVTKVGGRNASVAIARVNNAIDGTMVTWSAQKVGTVTETVSFTYKGKKTVWREKTNRTRTTHSKLRLPHGLVVTVTITVPLYGGHGGNPTTVKRVHLA